MRNKGANTYVPRRLLLCASERSGKTSAGPWRLPDCIDPKPSAISKHQQWPAHTSSQRPETQSSKHNPTGNLVRTKVSTLAFATGFILPFSSSSSKATCSEHRGGSHLSHLHMKCKLRGNNASTSQHAYSRKSTKTKPGLPRVVFFFSPSTLVASFWT